MIKCLLVTGFGQNEEGSKVYFSVYPKNDVCTFPNFPFSLVTGVFLHFLSFCLLFRLIACLCVCVCVCVCVGGGVGPSP